MFDLSTARRGTALSRARAAALGRGGDAAPLAALAGGALDAPRQAQQLGRNAGRAVVAGPAGELPDGQDRLRRALVLRPAARDAANRGLLRPLARSCSGTRLSSARSTRSVIGAREAAMGIGIVSAVTEMCPGDAPPRRARAARARRGASSPFLFGCLLIDRVAAVRSVDFATEEGVVAPPGGAPGTPAGYCWLLDVSLRRVARSGWTCGVGDGHDDLRDVQALRSRSYVPFLPFSFFLFPTW